MRVAVASRGTWKRRTHRWQALSAWMLLACSLCPAQITYYVNGACGDDSWSGLTAACEAPDGPKATIQAAINAAADGDTVLVGPGTYVGNYQLSRVLTLRSTDGAEVTTLRPWAWSPILQCNVAMTDSPTISGFRFQDGGAYTWTGGAINVISGSPVVTDCEFYGNRAVAGGAIYAPNGSLLTLRRCVFGGNIALTTNPEGSSSAGAVRAHQFVVDACRFENNRAIYFCLFNCYGGSWGGALIGTGTVTNSTFVGNGAGEGAALALGAGSSIINCTIVNNAGADEFFGTAILGEVSISNSIVYGNVVYGYNPSPQIDPRAVVRYCNVEGGYPGTGNIDADPRFVVDPDGTPELFGCFSCPIAVGDLRLRAGAPCIDAGDNAALPPDEFDLDGDGNTTEPIPFDLAGLPRVVRGLLGSSSATVDMGAYERQIWKLHPVLSAATSVE